MIKVIYKCDRCNRKKELKSNPKEDSKEVFDVHIYHHGDRSCYTTPMVKTQLCPECELELEKWLHGKKSNNRADNNTL